MPRAPGAITARRTVVPHQVAHRGELMQGKSIQHGEEGNLAEAAD